MTDQEWKEVQAAALKEGKVVFYGDPNVGMMAKIQADFEKANPGIVLERSRMVGPALIGKIEAGWPMSRLSELIPHRWAAEKAAEKRPQ